MFSPPLDHRPTTKNDEATSSTLLERLPSPPNAEPLAPEEVTEGIEDRWLATVKKADKLKARLKHEKASINALVEEYHAGQYLDIALHDRIATREAWLQSMLQNFNSAVRDHTQCRSLTRVKALQAMIRGIEQKQLAVEVALQQGIDQQVGGSGRDVAGGNAGKVMDETLPTERMFKMADATGLKELDFSSSTVTTPIDTRHNTPDIGSFTVPKPGKSSCRE